MNRTTTASFPAISLQETSEFRVDGLSTQNTGNSLAEYWFTIRKRWPIVVMIFFVFMIAGVFYTNNQEKLYRTSASVAVFSPTKRNIGNIQVDQGYTSRSYLNTQIAILKSRNIGSKVLAKLPDSICLSFFGKKADDLSPGHVLRAITVTNIPNTEILHISCIGKSPEDCAHLANLFVDVFIQENKEQLENSQSSLLNWIKKEIPVIEQKMLKILEITLKFEESHPEVLELQQNQTNATQGDMLDRLRQEIQTTRIQMVNAEIEYNKIQNAKKIGTLQAILGLDYFSGESVTTSLIQQKIKLQETLSDYRQRYTAKHPKIISLEASIEAVDKKLRENADLVMARKEQIYIDLQQKKDTLEKMAQLQQAKNTTIKQSFLKYQHYRREYESLQKTQNSFLDKMKELDSTINYDTESVRLIDKATVPNSPYKPDKVQNYFVSGILGIIAGLGLIFFLETLDDRLKTPEEIQQTMGASLLGNVPFMPEKSFPGEKAGIVFKREHSFVAEAFQAITANLMFSENRATKRCHVLTSPIAHDGKTTVLCNIATSIAMTGRRTLLVDGDLRKPRLHKVFKANNEKGFTQVLKQEAHYKDLCQPTDIPNLFLLPSGKIPVNTYECIHSSPLKRLLLEMQEDFEYVFIDTPPIGITTDALLFAKTSQSLLLVVSIQRSFKKMLQHLAQRIHSLELPLEGIILNDLEGNLPTKDTYYSYGNYHYYQHYGEDAMALAKKEQTEK